MDQFTSLSDYRTQVADMYALIRATRDPEAAWHEWRRTRDSLFASHPQSPLESSARSAGYRTPFTPYDPTFRVAVPLVETETPAILDLSHSAGGVTPFSPVGTVSGTLPTGDFTLTVYWLNGYGGGLFLPFRDTTNSETTYGGGRYLLDTVKSADLGRTAEGLILDFNFAYHPSCVYSDKWSCPLAPVENHLKLAISVGEQLTRE